MYSADTIITHLNRPTEADRRLIKKAYAYAESAHSGHRRYSGEPYLSHVAAVGHMLAAMGMGPRTISAGLLHDIIEDTPVSSEDIQKEFGDEIKLCSLLRD